MHIFPINWPGVRQSIVVSGFFGLLWFSWASHARTLFNGLATPLFFALSAFLLFLATQYRIAVSRGSLVIYVLFACWVLHVDANSGEFLPALAKDSHWLVLPVASLLFAQAFREYPKAFEFVQIGAALCIINLLATMFTMAEWFDNWHYPPVFGHIRHLGLSIGFLSIMLFSRTASSTGTAVLFRICRIIGLAIVFWSGTRASILAWIVCMVIFVSIDRNWLREVLLDTAMAIALSQLPPPPFPLNQWTPGVVKRTMEEVIGNASTETSAISARLSIWRATLAALCEGGHLWTGLGGNGFARLQVIHNAQISWRPQVHPHNVIVQFICDWGIIGALSVSMLFTNAVLLPTIRNFKASNPVAVSGICYLVITGMFDATLFHLEHLVYMMFGFGLLFSNRLCQNTRDSVLQKYFLIILLAGLVMVHFMSFDYRIGIVWYFPTK